MLEIVFFDRLIVSVNGNKANLICICSKKINLTDKLKVFNKNIIASVVLICKAKKAIILFYLKVSDRFYRKFE